MYTRLFVDVLNRYSFCHNIKSVLHPFEGTSLFGISAQCDANAVVSMVEVNMCYVRALHGLFFVIEFVPFTATRLWHRNCCKWLIR